MAYIVKDEQNRPVIYRGSNIMGSDSFDDVECLDFNDKDRSFLAVGSQESPDRFQDVIQVDGWELKNYRKNPVILFAHIYSKPPIGRSLEEFSDVKKGVKRLMIRPQFHALDEEARLLYSLYKESYLKGFSVGFLPKKSEEIKQDGKKKKDDDDHPFFHRPTLFKKHELLENSSVPLPAHPDCLSEIKAMVKKGTLYVPARYLQEEQVPEVETYDEYIHVKVEDEGRFTSLYEDEIGEGITRVYGFVEEENGYIDHKFIFAKDKYNEEQAKDSIGLLAEESYSGEEKNYDPESYTARETVLIADFPTVSDEDFEEGRKELDMSTKGADSGNEQGDAEEEEAGSTEEGIECGDCLEVLAQEYVVGEDMEFAEEEYIGDEDVEERPYPNEHACRLLPPGDFDRFARKKCFRRSGGKCVDFIFGIKAGKSKTQAMRYKKAAWTAAAARGHCKGAGGTFEAAGAASLEDFKVQVEKQWNIKITDEAAEILMKLPGMMDLDVIDAVLKVSDALSFVRQNDKKIFVYSVDRPVEKEDIVNIKKQLQDVLGEDVKVIVLDSGATLTRVKDVVPEEDEEHDDGAAVEDANEEDKGIGGNKRLPMDPGDEWDVAAVVPRMRRWAGGLEKEDIDWKKYRQGFVWFDSTNPKEFGSYRLPFADVVDGTLKAKWGGIRRAMADVLSARGGITFTERDRKRAYNFLKAYYAKFERPAPDYRGVSEDPAVREMLSVLETLEAKMEITANDISDRVAGIVESKLERIVEELESRGFAGSAPTEDAGLEGDGEIEIEEEAPEGDEIDVSEGDLKEAVSSGLREALGRLD